MCGWGVRTPVKLIFRVSCWWCLCIVVVVCTQLIIRQDFSLWYSHNSVLCTWSWGSAEILVKYRNWNHRWSENFKPYHLILFLILLNTSPLLVSVIGIPLSFPHILNKNEMDQNGQKWIKMEQISHDEPWNKKLLRFSQAFKAGLCSSSLCRICVHAAAGCKINNNIWNDRRRDRITWNNNNNLVMNEEKGKGWLCSRVYCWNLIRRWGIRTPSLTFSEVSWPLLSRVISSGSQS